MHAPAQPAHHHSEHASRHPAPARVRACLRLSAAALAAILSLPLAPGCASAPRVEGVRVGAQTTRLLPAPTALPALPPSPAASPAAAHASAHADFTRALALRLLDHEALYTVAGIKPLSTGFWHLGLDASESALPPHERTRELENLRAALAPLSRWPFYADVQTFATQRDGRRHVEAYIMHLPLLRSTLAAHDVFARHGLTPTTHPAEVLAVVERMPRLERFEAYGHLFGYPSHAVRFFVEASTAEPTDGSGASPRDFLHIPTFASATNRFVYAVPKGHEPNQDDLALRDRAKPVLEAYLSRRERYVGEAPTPPGPARAPRADEAPQQDQPPAPPPPPPARALELFWSSAGRP